MPLSSPAMSPARKKKKSMGRTKLQLKLISDEKRRRATYKKRINGLKKKAFELATLCGIGVGLVSFGPDGQVHTWPENHHDFLHVIGRFLQLNKEDQEKHQVDLSHYLEAKITKLKAELAQFQTCSSKPNQEDDFGGLLDLDFDGLDELLELGENELQGDGDSTLMPSLENNEFPELEEMEHLQDWSSIELFADTTWM